MLQYQARLREREPNTWLAVVLERDWRLCSGSEREHRRGTKHNDEEQAQHYSIALLCTLDQTHTTLAYAYWAQLAFPIAAKNKLHFSAHSARVFRSLASNTPSTQTSNDSNRSLVTLRTSVSSRAASPSHAPTIGTSDLCAAFHSRIAFSRCAVIAAER